MSSPEYKKMGLSQVEFEESIDVGYLVLHNGRKIPIVSNAAGPLWQKENRKIAVVRGKLVPSLWPCFGIPEVVVSY